MKNALSESKIRNMFRLLFWASNRLSGSEKGRHLETLMRSIDTVSLPAA